MAGSSSKSVMTVDKSNGSKAPSTTTGRKLPSQMEMDHPDSSLSSERAAMAEDNVLDHELIQAKSRDQRLPSTVPSPSLTSTTLPTFAIPAQQNTTTSNSSQDVRFSVNTTTSLVRSPAISAYGQSPRETIVSTFTPPLTQHDLKHPIRRPRTSTSVFQSSTDLAAHYGIPQRLPPAPSTSYTTPTASSSRPPATIVDFQTLSQNYLNMLSNKPSDTTVATSAPPTMTELPVSAADLNAPLVASDTEALNQIAALLAASPEFRDMHEFMTSPMTGMESDFGVSPEETPFHDFLNTPLVGDDDDLFTSPLIMDAPMFPSFIDDIQEISAAPKAPYASPFEGTYTISPFSPNIESFADPNTFPTSPSIAPAPSTASPAPTKEPAAARRSRATGIRKGVTPDTLLDEDAPTQSRKYTTPSATSKKEIPATFARKRGRSAAFGEEEDQLLDNELPLNPTEKDLIEQKRRQNTVAARRSRKRKLEQYQNMEKARDEEKELKELWKERALVLLATLRKHGVNYPDFPEDVQHYSNL